VTADVDERMACTHAQLIIEGRVAGKARHRSAVIGGQVRQFDPKTNRAAATRIAEAWQHANRPWFADAPVGMEIVIHEQRPAGHWTGKGELSAAGRRSPVPARKPDLDNVAKQICDALNGRLWHDDAQVYDLRARKEWCASRDTPEVVVVTAWTIDDRRMWV